MGASPERTESIYREAAELPPAEREVYLDRACEQDSELRQQIESLLSQLPQFRAGDTVGPYRIEGTLGEGGMGVVYKAEDTRLHRAVALKFIKAGFAERMQSEAQAISALNHPHVATLYDLCRHGDTPFLVLEYVEGKPLKGPLPLSSVLTYAIQVGSALEAAHASGIVHRDLKPSNIMVTRNGVVKVLDFGLAKWISGAHGETTLTRTMTAHTQEGTIVGTAHYMSPEQAQGAQVDARSDIFSFGTVIYEMVCGRKAFPGKSTISVIAAVLEREPEPLTGIPEDLKHVLCRALRKDPARRWQHVDDMRLALEEVKSNCDLCPPPRQKPGPRRRRPIAIAAALVLLATAAGFALWRSALVTPAATAYRFEQITDEPGQEKNPVLSPDGKSVAYASRASGNWGIYVLRVGGKNPTNLTAGSTADDTEPAFSPDGERIAFRSERDGGGIFVMGSTGESVRRLTDFCYYPAWSPSGKEIACSTANPYRPDVRESASSQIYIIDAGSGASRLASAGVQDAVQPSWSPDGRRIAFWGVREGARDIFTIGREGGQAASVTNDDALDWNPVWSPDGAYLYFSSNRGGAMNIWRIAMDAAGKAAGAPESIGVPSSYAAAISFSADGKRLAYANCQRSSNIYLVGFDAAQEQIVGAPRPLTQGIKETLYPTFSRDGAWIAYSQFGLHEDVVVVRPDGRDLRRITDDAARDRAPRWSPDGQSIAFMSSRSGRFEIWTIRPDGSGLKQVTEGSPRGGVWYPAWSPDGRKLSYSLPDEMGFIIDTAKPWREQQPRPALAQVPAGNWLWLNDWSHDGARIGGTLMKIGGASLGSGAYELATKKLDLYTNYGQLPRWLPDGRRLLFHARGGIFLVDSADHRVKEILSLKSGDITPYFDVSWDGRQIAFSLESMDADVWIMTRLQ